jgi:putative Mn2+ efflux pump MntP
LTALILVALALGIDNLAVSVGIGVSGVRAAVRARVAIVFGVFEAGMPVLGMALGRSVSTQLGDAAQWLGGGLLAVVGLHQIIAWLRHRRAAGPNDSALNGSVPNGSGPNGSWGSWRLLASGLALSIDNLVVGFARRLPRKHRSRRPRDRPRQCRHVACRA